MQLTYTAEWVCQDPERRTLQVGIYLAQVFRHADSYKWGVDSDRGDRPPFVDGSETSWESACEAAEAAISEHHATNSLA